jgi:hypothetical protein
MPDVYRFLLRLPQPLRERLVQAAERSGRSLNAELVHRLERSLDPWALRRRRAVEVLAAARATTTKQRALAFLAGALTALALAAGMPHLHRGEPGSRIPVATGLGVPMDGQALAPRAVVGASSRRVP